MWIRNPYLYVFIIAVLEGSSAYEKLIKNKDKIEEVEEDEE